MNPFTMLAIGGTIFGSISQYNQGQAQAEYLRAQAKLDNQRADEYLLRTERNIESRKKQANIIAGTQKTLLAESGIDIGFGVSLDVLESTYENLAEEVMLAREEASYQALSIRSGAEANRSQASDVSRAGSINAVTTLLGGLSRLST